MVEHLKPEPKHHNINAKQVINLSANRLLTLNRNRMFTITGICDLNRKRVDNMHMCWEHGVAGSNPLPTSMKHFKPLAIRGFVFYGGRYGGR